MTYDLLLRNGRVVDPGNRIDMVADIAIEGSQIADVAPEIDPNRARRTWDLQGYVVAPGLIDHHMHSTLGVGGDATFAMLARAGVSTATDFAGPPSRVIDGVARAGSGISIATLQVLRPNPAGGSNPFASGPATELGSPSPSRDQIERAVEAGIAAGAIGTKILGGHFPFTPEATLAIIEESRRRGVYMALHVGTTATGSNLLGLEEAIGFAAPDRRIHLCHINSALRGQVLSSRLEEASRAMTLLREQHASVVSESFLTRWSPDPGLCVDGVPDSAIVRTSLGFGGYEPTEDGLAKGIAEGFVAVLMPGSDANRYAFGEEALRFWRDHDTNTGIAFPISYADVGLICATDRRPDGAFTVTAFASDAGQFPLNVTLDHGLLLVEFGALTLSELIWKASFIPSRMMGIPEKGHLAPGADADIVVIDLDRRRAAHLLVAGELVMTDGAVIGQGGTILTTTAALASVQERGLPARAIDLQQSLLYTTNENSDLAGNPLH